jgi:hypothetical protein
MAIEIVSFPMKNGGSVHRFWYVYQIGYVDFFHHPQFQWNIPILGSTKNPPRFSQVDTTSKTFLEDLSCALKERQVEILLANTIMSLGHAGSYI